MKVKKVEQKSIINLPKVWQAFVLVRILWTIIGQRGYLHPDEYFQSLEVVTSDLFNKHAYRTWEFQVTNSTKPIRNIAIPYLIYGLSIKCLNILTNIGLASITTNTLILFPRLMQTMLSLLGDYYVYKTAKLLNLNANNCLILYSSSYVTLVYLTHTFSNSLETILFAALLYYTVKSAKSSLENVPIIGLITCIGVFNRPTFIIYAFVPILYLAYRHKNLLKYLGLLLSYSLVTAASLVIVDTFYYTSNLDFDNLIITPLNFFMYNINQDNLTLHGAHPIYQHIIVNCLMLFGLQYLKFYRNFKMNFLCFTFIFVLFVFSLVAHKEARFLLPLLIVICLLTSSGNEFFSWYLFNFILAFVYGVYHQGALIESLDFIQNMFKHQANEAIDQHVFYYQTYMPPRYLVNVQFKSEPETRNQIYDLMSSMDYSQLENYLENTYRNVSKDNLNGNFAFFLVTPSINDDRLCNAKRVKFSLLVQFYFNIQFENYAKYFDMIFCNYETCNYQCKNMNIFERFFYTFTLNLYQFFV
jgi:phosphatidylinositol glycan class Z